MTESSGPASSEVRKLAESDPGTAVRHPDCPPELWRELAKDHPEEARSNPALPLFALENPTLYSWDAIEREWAWVWIDATYPNLSAREQHLWSSDCAEHVLHVYEKERPGDMRPRHAIRMRRAWATGNVSGEEWNSAWLAARDAWYGVQEEPRYAVMGITTLSSDGQKSAALATGKTYSAEWKTEKLWQWRRLLQYRDKKLSYREMQGLMCYTVVQAGDPVRDEWVNIAVVAKCGDVIDYCLLKDTRRAAAYVGDWVIKYMLELAEDLKELQDYQDVTELDRRVREWAGSVTFTPWRYTTFSSAYRYCEEVSELFLL
jgi:hypothetical protein